MVNMPTKAAASACNSGLSMQERTQHAKSGLNMQERQVEAHTGVLAGCQCAASALMPRECA